MKVTIYINNKPISDYDPEELEEIKKELNRRAFAAAGYIPESEAKKGKRKTN